MTSIENRVLESVYIRLAEPDGLPDEMIERLRTLLGAERLPGPEQVVTALDSAAHGPTE